MNLTLLLQGSIEIGISFLSIFIIFFMSFKIFSLLTRKINEIEEINKNNIAVGIVTASFIFAIMLLVHSAVSSSMDSLVMAIHDKSAQFGSIFPRILTVLLMYLITLVFAFVLIRLIMSLFMIFTRSINEWEEIKNRNIAVSVILGTLLISSAFLLASPLKTLLEGFIAPPALRSTIVTVAKTPFNPSVLLRGAIELTISFISSLFTFFLSFRLFRFFCGKINTALELKNNNIAIAVFMSFFIFSIMICCKAAVSQINAAVYYAFTAADSSAVSILLVIVTSFVFYIAATGFALILITLSMRLFMLFTTKIDELKALKNNNIAVAVIIGVFLLSASFMCEHGLQVIFSAWVKTPEVFKGIW